MSDNNNNRNYWFPFKKAALFLARQTNKAWENYAEGWRYHLTPEPQVVKREQTVAEASRLMTERRIRVCLWWKRKLVGIITSRDLASRLRNAWWPT